MDEIKYLIDPLWLLGFLFLNVASLIHLFVLPFADLVLLSTHCAWCVVFCQVLAITVLKEKFIFCYDFPALLSIIIGSLIIVCVTPFEEVSYTKDEIVHLMFRPSSLTIYFLYTCLALAAALINKRFNIQLNQIDAEVDHSLQISESEVEME